MLTSSHTITLTSRKKSACADASSIVHDTLRLLTSGEAASLTGMLNMAWAVRPPGYAAAAMAVDATHNVGMISLIYFRGRFRFAIARQRGSPPPSAPAPRLQGRFDCEGQNASGSSHRCLAAIARRQGSPPASAPAPRLPGWSNCGRQNASGYSHRCLPAITRRPGSPPPSAPGQRLRNRFDCLAWAPYAFTFARLCYFRVC
eukprot:SAG31_NODE_12951_length_904_cov_4.132919_2_plen_202_part_00